MLNMSIQQEFEFEGFLVTAGDLDNLFRFNSTFSNWSIDRLKLFDVFEGPLPTGIQFIYKVKLESGW